MTIAIVSKLKYAGTIDEIFRRYECNRKLSKKARGRKP